MRLQSALSILRLVTASGAAWGELSRFVEEPGLSFSKFGVYTSPLVLQHILEKLERPDQNIERIILTGYIHPLTIASLHSNIPISVFSLYDDLAIGSQLQGWYRGMFVEYFSGNEGATVGTAFGGSEALVLRTEQTLMEGFVPSNRMIQKELDGFFNSSIFIRVTTSAEAYKPPVSGTLQEHAAFIGSDKCGKCHLPEYAQWKDTQHAGALKTLIDRHRNHSPECVGCHVTGFGQKGGYILSHPEQNLANVGCEVCHGAGLTHAAKPHLQKMAAVTVDVCKTCHTAEHSLFSEKPTSYLKKVTHLTVRNGL